MNQNIIFNPDIICLLYLCKLRYTICEQDKTTYYAGCKEYH